MFLSRKTSTRKAFTLLELIVVIVILGILAALAIPTFKTVIDRSTDEVTISGLESLSREAQALYAFGDVTWEQAMEQAAADLAPVAAGVGVFAAGTPLGDPGVMPGKGDLTTVGYEVAGDDKAVVVARYSKTGNVCFALFTSTSLTESACADVPRLPGVADTARPAIAVPSTFTTAPPTQILDTNPAPVATGATGSREFLLPKNYNDPSPGSPNTTLTRFSRSSVPVVADYPGYPSNINGIGNYKVSFFVGGQPVPDSDIFIKGGTSEELDSASKGCVDSGTPLDFTPGSYCSTTTYPPLDPGTTYRAVVTPMTGSDSTHPSVPFLDAQGNPVTFHQVEFINYVVEAGDVS